MNTVWSKYIQGVKTLYCSRKLRFHDMFSEQYKALFDLDETNNLKILEIGCGPGALAESLHRWYPNTQITAVDRDSAFIAFAEENAPEINFIEGDATSLPFENDTFDVTISNTVSEHIEPSEFFSEQLRVLKPGGICLVLSARKGITAPPSCVAPDKYEEKFWSKVQKYDDSMNRYDVCKYPMSEAELPAAMEKYGFISITTGYAVIDLTPDNPKFDVQTAHAIINADRENNLEGIESVMNIMPDRFTPSEIEEMKRLTNAKYDKRIEQYDCGKKQWDTNVSITMVIRGIK